MRHLLYGKCKLQQESEWSRVPNNFQGSWGKAKYVGGNLSSVKEWGGGY